MATGAAAMYAEMKRELRGIAVNCGAIFMTATIVAPGTSGANCIAIIATCTMTGTGDGSDWPTSGLCLLH